MIIVKSFIMKINLLLIFICIYINGSYSSCPNECECYYVNNGFFTDCSERGLKCFPDDIDEEVEYLDLSGNLFTSIPNKISSLTWLIKLNMSRNNIMTIDSQSFINMTMLEILDLSENNIETWIDINPNDFLKPATNLKHLILSGNKLKKFSELDETEYLVSDSLETLEVSNCEFITIGKIGPLIRLSNLKTLILSQNPLRWMAPLKSPTLEHLDISQCALTFVHNIFLDFLPRLTKLNMSYNNRLILKKEISFSSMSLKEIDLSYCNLVTVDLNGLPYIEKIILRRNMIGNLIPKMFVNNSYLEYLDLSSNVVNDIKSDVFSGLSSLKQLNLSINYINDIHPNALNSLTNLTELILSRNSISNINKLNSPSLKILDISICEIQYLEHDAFQGMPSLVDLDLSRNAISYIPSLKSDSIQKLNLNYNRLSVIDNMTFHFLPELTELFMSGNRFTSIWKSSYFLNNSKLDSITLNDNMWRCDCFDEDSKMFFLYITSDPPKVQNLDLLRCHSPANVSGDKWINACYKTWFPSVMESNKAMNFLLIILGSFFLCFIILYLVRKSMRKKIIHEERERLRRVSEARERQRDEIIRQEQEAFLNAPDPRDLISPPSYDEALKMPKLDSSFHSLSNIYAAEKKQKKRMRRRTRSSGDLLDENYENRPRRKSRSRSGQRRQRFHSTNEIDTVDDSDEVHAVVHTDEVHTDEVHTDVHTDIEPEGIPNNRTKTLHESDL